MGKEYFEIIEHQEEENRPPLSFFLKIVTKELLTDVAMGVSNKTGSVAREEFSVPPRVKLTEEIITPHLENLINRLFERFPQEHPLHDTAATFTLEIKAGVKKYLSGNNHSSRLAI